jgi:hypothetical protein
MLPVGSAAVRVALDVLLAAAGDAQGSGRHVGDDDGATNVVSTEVLTPAPMVVRCLRTPS